MKKNIKVIDFFKIIIVIVILTIILTIISIKKIEKTNKENQSVGEQKQIIEAYISENQNAENTKKLLKELEIYLSKKQEYPNMIPIIEFYGKDNANKIIMYTVTDKIQEEYYKKELENIIKEIKSEDTFYITTENNNSEGYINKIIIEYNY